MGNSDALAISRVIPVFDHIGELISGIARNELVYGGEESSVCASYVPLCIGLDLHERTVRARTYT